MYFYVKVHCYVTNMVVGFWMYAPGKYHRHILPKNRAAGALIEKERASAFAGAKIEDVLSVFL